MTEHELIIFLCGCIGAMGFALIFMDRLNDKLMEENKRLRRRLKESEAAEAQERGKK